MIQSMTTGHDGSMSTVHANDCRDAVNRLEMLVGLAGLELPIWFIHRMIVSAIDIVVHCARLSGGVRKIVQISELAGLEGNVVNMHDIFRFEQTGMDQEKMAVGHFRATGIQPRCLNRLAVSGVELPRTMFESREMRIDRNSALGYAPRP
jgi:pilus assembly protein CpaF